MFERRFEAVLTMLLAWVTALSLSLAGPASATPGVHDPSPDEARASLELGIAGLAVTALYCLFEGWIHSRETRDGGARAMPHALAPQPDTQAPLIDAKGRGHGERSDNVAHGLMSASQPLLLLERKSR